MIIFRSDHPGIMFVSMTISELTVILKENMFLELPQQIELYMTCIYI